MRKNIYLLYSYVHIISNGNLGKYTLFSIKRKSVIFVLFSIRSIFNKTT
jgi:hypothetical protein